MWEYVFMKKLMHMLRVLCFIPSYVLLAGMEMKWLELWQPSRTMRGGYGHGSRA